MAKRSVESNSIIGRLTGYHRANQINGIKPDDFEEAQDIMEYDGKKKLPGFGILLTFLTGPMYVR